MNDSIKSAPIETGAEPDRWVLHSEGRQFGPFSGDELRRYFTAGMVKATDSVSGPAVEGIVPATLAAAALGMDEPREALGASASQASPNLATASPMPVPAAAAPPRGASPSVAFVYPDDDTTGPSGVVVALWLAALFAIQFFIVPKNSLGADSTLNGFIVTVFMRTLGIGAICFALWFLVGRLLSSRQLSLNTPLLLMTLVYAGLVADHLLHPEAPNAAAPHFVVAGIPSARAPEAGREQERLRYDRAQFQFPAAAPPLTAMSDQGDSEPAAPVASLPTPDPQSPERSARTRDLWEDSAHELFDKQDWQGLENLAERWAVEQPSRGRAWMFLGMARNYLRKFDEALVAYTQAVRLSPDDAWVLFNTGLLYTSMLDSPKAVAMYHRALDVNPGMVEAWNNLGNEKARMHEHEAAIDAWGNVVRLSPGYVMAWDNLGWEYYRLNQFPKAIECFEKALAIEPTNERAKTGLLEAKQR